MYLLFFNNSTYELLTNYNNIKYILLIKYLIVVCILTLLHFMQVNNTLKYDSL